MKMKSVGTLVKHPVAFILIVLVLIFILLVSSKAAMAAQPPTFDQILEVIDGNTLKVSTSEDDTFVVLLKGVDAPEPGQDFAEEALIYLEKLVNNKQVNIEFGGKDRKGNRLVYITTKNGSSVNEKMIREGYGWVDRFFLQDSALISLQDIAKSKKNGLWDQTNPVEPWVYDRNQIRLSFKGR